MILKTLQRSGNPLASPQQQRQVLQDATRLPGIDFSRRLIDLDLLPLRRKELATLQVNLGRLCNQTCSHCHVDAGPDRRESMTFETAGQVIDFLGRSNATTLDITGGAPEMNPHFRWLVQEAVRLGRRVIDRCNLTILVAKGFHDLPEFLARQNVTIIASLPCYLQENCDAQRGDGVFEKSIQAIRRLNELGYGNQKTNLELNLVYNPTGFGLPPAQQTLEDEYRRQLWQRYGIEFNRLFTITNLPISRFLDDLLSQQKYEQYMQLLIQSFNQETIENVMCRSLVSVDWQGYCYDCDFNQMLDLPVMRQEQRLHISECTAQRLIDRPISVGNHCYGCTAGSGSSCSGSLLPQEI